MLGFSLYFILLNNLIIKSYFSINIVVIYNSELTKYNS